MDFPLFRKLLLLIITLSLAPTVWAKPEKYLVGVEALDYYPHYQFRYEDKQFGGYARVVLEMFAQSRGIEFQFVGLPVRRLYHEFLHGDLDFKYPDHAHWQTQSKEGINIHYSQPVIQFIDGVLVTPEALSRPPEIKRLGTILGFTPLMFQEQIQSGAIEFSENRDFEGLLRQVLMGRIDGAYVNVSVGAYKLETSLRRPGALIFDSRLPHHIDHYHFSTLKHPEVIKEFNQFLEANRNILAQKQKEMGIIHQPNPGASPSVSPSK